MIRDLNHSPNGRNVEKISLDKILEGVYYEIVMFVIVTLL